MDINKTLAVLVLAGFVTMTLPLNATGATVEFALPEEGSGNGTDGFIIAFRELPDIERGDSYNGATVTHVLEGLDMIFVKTDDAATFKMRTRLDDNVRYVEWDDPQYAELNFVPNDALYSDPGHWGSKRIGGEVAWDTTLGSTAVKVAMIDTGLNKGHEEYSGQSRVLQGYDAINGDTDPEDDGGPCGYHGTHTTGTAGATTNNGKGIAGMSQHSILPIKIFYMKNPRSCPTSTTAIVDALKYAGDQGAHLSSNSWGGGSSSTAINDAIKYAHSLGTIHVAAAGNSGPCTNCVGQPWKDNPTITIIVSASASDDSFASFSSQGPEVDIIGPGVDILSTTSGTSTYAAYDGTSMATPHVTGALALYIAATGNTAYSTVESDLKSTAENLNLAPERQGSGLVRADSLVALAGGNLKPTASFTYTCSSLTCDFDGTGSTDSDGVINSYSWDFGDGTTATGSTVTHTFGASGDYTVTLTVTDDAGATDSDSQVVSVSDGSSTALLSENFDDGAADGWTKSSGSTDLWRVASDCVTPNSGTYDLAFSRASPDCDYDVGTAVGWAATPVIDASAYGTVTLDFTHFWETESYSNPYDVQTVQVSSDGGSSWTTIAQWDSSLSNPSTWQSESFDISSYATSTLQVRFHFDSKDSVSNDFLGWYVDDVAITGS